MLKKWVIGIYAIFFSFVGFSSSAQVLWGNAERGMTIDQVLETVEGIELVEERSVFNDTAIEKARVNGIQIAGKKFFASFYFREGGLAQVHLSLDENVSKAEANLIYDHIVTALQSKYGKVYSSENKPGAMQIRGMTWLSGRVNITATLLAFDDGSGSAPLVQIAYQTRIAESADNL